MSENNLKKAFLNGLGLNGFQMIESLKYKGYAEDIQNFRKDSKKITETYKLKNDKKHSS